MSYRLRGKGYQIDISHNNKRYRAQIVGDKSDAILTESLCNKMLDEGKSWSDIVKTIETSKHDVTVGTIYKRVKHTYNDKHGVQTAFNLVNQIGIDKKITDIDEDTIDILIEEWKSKGNSNATCNRKLAALSKLLSFAYKRKYIKSKPQIEWLKEGAGRVRYMKPEEQDKFCKVLRSAGHDDLADMIIVACDIGFRKSEIRRIDLKKDLDGDRLTCQATKNDVIRTITLTRRAKSILVRRGNTPFINISDEYMRSAWNYGKIKLGLELDNQFTFHCTRHTCASRLVQAGIAIQVVQAWLGHKTIKMTLRYAHLAPHNFVEARNVLNNVDCDGIRDKNVISM